MNVFYALQTCDAFSNQCKDRYTGTTKKEITWKCVTSFFTALKYAAKENKEVSHIVRIFDDRSSEETVEYLKLLTRTFNVDNIQIEFTKTKTPGIMESIRECYEWLYDFGTDLVYQVQDDYLFHETSIYEMIDVWYQIFHETGSHAMISPFNDNWLWLHSYRNITTPRAVISGCKRYWIQYYDTSCSFLTSIYNFKKYWKYLDDFLRMPSTGDDNHNLENVTINRILTRNDVLGLIPMPSIALHLQSELEKDPYVDWKQWWDDVKILSM